MNDLTEHEQLLVEWIAAMREDEAVSLATAMLHKQGADPRHVLKRCRAAMDLIGKGRRLVGYVYNTNGSIANHE